MPVYADVEFVARVLPGHELARETLECGNASVCALPRHGRQFAFSDVEPRTMLGCVMDFKSTRNSPRLVRRKAFIQTCGGVDVEVVKHKHNPFDMPVCV